MSITSATKKKKLNKKVLITAGPTYELIDPVRFIGNFSSGKMGFAIAEAYANQGCQVTLIAGPVHLQTQHPNIKRIDITSAEEMYNATLQHFPNTHIAVFCAAVADYAPAEKADIKIKRKADEMVIRLKPNKDIAAAMGAIKSKSQFLIGFALETNNETFNAQSKLQKKNLDMIVLNSLQDKGAGFGHDTNKVTFFHNDGNKKAYPLLSKDEVASEIVKASLS